MVKRLFVGNIPYDASVDALRTHFEACGEVAEIEIATDGPGARPRGHAFVTMAAAEGARAAMERLDGESFDGRPLHVVADDDDGGEGTRLARVLRRLLGYVRYARDHEGAAAVSLFLFDEATGDLNGVLAAWDWTRASFPSHVSAWPSVAMALAKRELRVITAEDANGAEEGWFETRGIAATVCVPLCDEVHRLGVLFFDFDASAGPIARVDLPFLADVGTRCARAVGRSKAVVGAKST